VVFARHYDALAGLMQRQESLVHGAALLAPGLGLRAISAAAAGTDLGAQLKFHRDAEAHRYAFVQKLNQLHRDEIRFAGDRDQRLGAATWSAFPDFHAQAPALRDALRDSGLAWLALLLWAAAPLIALLRTRALRP
jgi:ABC-2 type transport system permease protein